MACWSFCEHGGVCELNKGHDGLHDSGYCRWDDAHAVTEAEADAALISKDPYLGPAIAKVTGALRDIIEEGDN